ncbi:MAG: hypothetical protein GXY85_07025 [Candidatus Brocadiaceae bacterium]|nr:hypothetical protein [Candidatus Brocadiaceae bacterium]
MSAFRWGMVAVGAFLALYAAATLLRARGEAHQRRTTMGCGFVLLAGLVWGYALGGFLDDPWGARRLGMAFALVLPALAALANPGRRGIVMAMAMLVVAVALGADQVAPLLRRVHRTPSGRVAGKVSGTLEEARARIESTRAVLADLEAERADLRRAVQATGHRDFESLAADPQAYTLLTELAEVDRLLESARTRLERLSVDVPRLESALRRLERFERAEAATGEEVARAEIEQIVARLQAEAVETGPVTVEEHMQRQALRAMFEAEFEPR